MQDVDIAQGLDTTLTIIHHKLKGGITVTREYAPRSAEDLAYGGELNQIWTNLISNAIDAMQARRELRVRTAREHDYVLVEIGDNGPGIPPTSSRTSLSHFLPRRESGKERVWALITAVTGITAEFRLIRIPATRVLKYEFRLKPRPERAEENG